MGLTVQDVELLGSLIDKAGIVDLSHPFEENMPVWPTHARYGRVVYESYTFGDGAEQALIMYGEHSGTHIDAPKHFIPGGQAIDEVDVRKVIGRGYMIDATGLEKREALGLEAVKAYEAVHGDIRKGDIVLIHFGWDEKYAPRPDCDEFLKDWPGLGKDAAEYLRDKGVAVVGADTLSLDVFAVEQYCCHEVLLGAGIPILENVHNLAKLPVISYVIGQFGKIKDGSASPLNMIALITE